MNEESKLTWKEKTVIRILLIVAQIVCNNESLAKEITNLGNHIAAGFGE